MEKDELIERRADLTERRAYRLYLGTTAHTVIDEIMRVADRARGNVLAGLSGADKSQLMEVLEQVRATWSPLCRTRPTKSIRTLLLRLPLSIRGPYGIWGTFRSRQGRLGKGELHC
jgi:hypothetical protein